ncbi:MAG TPA: SDR family oxidoreductase [Anaerolineales bacterium]|nr:SDR family oxidoreductase [Anaerolineales bacterium]
MKVKNRNISKWLNKIAVVTGASSGIGAATARKLASQGLRVILVARRQERLEQLAAEIRNAGGLAEILPADLSQEAERQRVYSQVEGEYGRVDVLINNAGLGWYGYGTEMPWTIASKILHVNIEAVVHFTLLCLEKMRSLGSGHIINIGSISGSLPSQGVALYGATKSFLDNFTTALYRELTGTKLHVSVVRAGPVFTEFDDSVANLNGGLHLPTEHIGVSAETIANRIWNLLEHPRRVIYVPTWLGITPFVENTFGWIIDRLGPLLLRAQHRHK